MMKFRLTLGSLRNATYDKRICKKKVGKWHDWKLLIQIPVWC